QFIGLFLLMLSCFLISASDIVLAEIPIDSFTSQRTIGLAMVFALLTFGGWNESGYISAELKKGSRKMVAVLITSILIITGIYLLINLAFLKVLGIDGLASSQAPAIDLMRATAGEIGVVFIGILVAIARSEEHTSEL